LRRGLPRVDPRRRWDIDGAAVPKGLSRQSGWSRQVLLGLSVAPLGILSAVAFRINESPRWLLITGRRALAAQALNHLRQVGPRVLHGGGLSWAQLLRTDSPSHWLWRRSSER
jgi:hypothetical protein